ncbi:S-methyl-5-thioribose kinase [Mesorhizobium sp. M4B.F.Ca.ET.215.01.1.1]|uniref:S-methyl-5-thioribose kinase n=2 Tax=Mesorhizobium TaxID=68287 RepID=UPI000FD5FFC1|nr:MULTISPECIES: S-methyl-5-thioribose kinase [unclassified Mesorhizobium]RUW24851.1 S-methyl-5-thioribose kinase [Mesorhizobium sp. M4B.F.Ca.ET.013.02.1.1]RWF61596.1 MAG: S-methyl-5-thioribose kinase [Mesorhizobium sp.]TGQ18965.1 S-methyl-5-thioribose kinase [Mesorhizobium sp. M4B.F.Ca.ET.215.01.1.1]TGQ40578.1 S-methyl-5-thioribose kinase [Mesorhizobium sp. M4B.F.Ca.ET.214.01.1.1]TGQ49418.1 S-methyl-5-thioribose kinase [Mesorhizobium sp. M00.F.Ca.ET.220.01.1.1]
MTQKLPFEALSVETLPARLGANEAVTAQIGKDARRWKVREVGDGNLNLVFIVEGAEGAVVVKQALPYVRLVGDSWPLPLKRSFFEYHALTRQERRAPGSVPAIHHFDEAQALIVMEYLAPPHIILRRALIEGRQLPNIARDIGLFMARTLFRGSDLHMPTRDRKADLALFVDNVELCGITEDLVFTDPYFDAKLNRHTSPQLDGLVAELRADRDLKVEAQRLKHLFAANAETLLHGDLHSGSIMVTDTETRMIDPEFAFYGPIAFDVGMLLANFWMSFFSQRGHEQTEKRDAMRAYLLGVTAETWAVFRAEFSHLWRTERTGMLYHRSLFEDQGDRLGAEQALDHMLHSIWTDLLGFAGIEVHRRILGLAHNADFEAIADENLRATCEAKALKFGRHIAVNRRQIHGIDEVNNLAARIEQESSL